MKRHVGYACSKLDERNSEVALLLRKAGKRGSDRRSDNRLHPEMRRADDIIHVAERRCVRGDHVNVDPEPVGMQPDRLLDLLRAVDRVKRRVRVEHHLAATVDRLAPRHQELLDIRRVDLVAAEIDLDIGDFAAQPPGAVTGPDIVDGNAGHSLGLLDGLADRQLARFDVRDIAALHAMAFALARPEHPDPVLAVASGDQRAHLR